MVAQPAEQCCGESVQPFLASILEELMGPVSSGFSEVRALFEKEVDELSQSFHATQDSAQLKEVGERVHTEGQGAWGCWAAFLALLLFLLDPSQPLLFPPFPVSHPLFQSPLASPSFSFPLSFPFHPFIWHFCHLFNKLIDPSIHNLKPPNFPY